MEITANAAQTVAPNQAVLFTETAVPGNFSMIHREGSGLVGLRGLTNGQRRARFLVDFSANIADTTLPTPKPIYISDGSIAACCVGILNRFSMKEVPHKSAIELTGKYDIAPQNPISHTL